MILLLNQRLRFHMLRELRAQVRPIRGQWTGK
jgi:hypothetical protein